MPTNQASAFSPILLAVVLLGLVLAAASFLNNGHWQAMGLAGWAAVALLIARWVYVDAQRAGLPAMPWAVSGAVLLVIGLVLYLMTRDLGQRRTV